MGPTQTPIVHLHPSRRCNLACVHCYSSSGPKETESIPTALLVEAIAQANRQGYRVASFSGGEPFLYAGLKDALVRCKQLAMQTSVVSNGYFTRTKRFDECRLLIDQLAFSADGLADEHDRVRARAGAFRMLERGIEDALTAKMSVSLSCSVSATNWTDIEDVVLWAIDRGVKKIQFHPLEVAGRAGAGGKVVPMDDDQRTRFFVGATILQQTYCKLISIHIDLLHRSWIRSSPEIVYARDIGAASPASADSMAQIIGVLVLEASGRWSPISHGMSSQFSIGNLLDDDLAHHWSRYQHRGLPRLLEFCDEAARLWDSATHMPDVLDWHDWIVRRSATTYSLRYTPLNITSVPSPMRRPVGFINNI